jgi:hypothetical protein
VSFLKLARCLSLGWKGGFPKAREVVFLIAGKASFLRLERGLS